MAKHKFTVISITASGKQLVVPSLLRWNEVKIHLRDRLRYPVADPFVLFVVVLTKADGFSTTVCYQLTPPATRAFLEVKDREKDRWTTTKRRRGA